MLFAVVACLFRNQVYCIGSSSITKELLCMLYFLVFNCPVAFI